MYDFLNLEFEELQNALYELNIDNANWEFVLSFERSEI